MFGEDKNQKSEVLTVLKYNGFCANQCRIKKKEMCVGGT